MTRERSRSASLAALRSWWPSSTNSASASARRLEDKDALDVLRLLRGTEADSLADRLTMLAGDPVAGPSTRTAVVYLETVFVHRGAVGPLMAARAAAHVEPEEEIRAATAVLASQLLSEVRRRL